MEKLRLGRSSVAFYVFLDGFHVFARILMIFSFFFEAQRFLASLVRPLLVLP